MVVYIEYAFAENFLIDCALLYLALKASNAKIRVWRLLVSACLGAVFALIFPLLVLPAFLLTALKICIGFFMCAVALETPKNKKVGGRYAFTAVCFFVFTAVFAGMLTALGVKSAFVWLCVAPFCVGALLGIRKLYQKRAREKFIYACVIWYKQKEIPVSAFYDSGNFACFQGAPVCFVSPEIAFDFYEADEGQPQAETTVKTVSGEKRVRLYQGSLKIEENGKALRVEKVYFAVSPNMLSREYKLLLNSRIFEERTRL
jgi:hypothetical protein